MPIDVYLGKHTGSTSSAVLAVQAAWAVALLASDGSRSRAAPGSWWCRVAESFAVYCRLAGANIRAQLQYRVSFVLDSSATFLISFLDFLAVLILFHNVPRLAGWSVHEVAFLYGTSAIAFALAELLVGHSDQLAMRSADRHVRRPARAAARHALPGRGERAAAAPARQGAAGRSSSSSTRSRASNIDWTSAASQCCS